jgi:hypothetical protein
MSPAALSVAFRTLEGRTVIGAALDTLGRAWRTGFERHLG